MSVTLPFRRQTSVPAAVARVALVGFGTVGRAVARILTTQTASPLHLTCIINRHVERKVVPWVPEHVRWSDRVGDVLFEDVDIVVELIGGVDVAYDCARRALAAGKSVVTANKQLIAHRGFELAELARAHGRHLRFEAAVAGGVPVLRAVQEGLAADRLWRVAGILNGTCNYILGRIESEGLSFESALAEAQNLGLAEADPTDDVDGLDARAKLAILTAVGLQCRVEPSDIPCRSIRGIDAIDFRYARRLDATIKQISWAEGCSSNDEVVTASVGPALVPLRSSLAHVRDGQNLVTVAGERGGETAFSGVGAGGDATAVAVVSDLLSIAHAGSGYFHSPLPLDAPVQVVNADDVAPRYVRFTVADRPGIIASIAGLFSKHGINIEAIFQEPDCPKTRLPFVVTLEPCRQSAVAAAVGEMSHFDFQIVPPLVLPILSPTKRGASAAHGGIR